MEEAGLRRDWQPESWQDILDACAAIKEKCGDDVVPIWFACSNTEAEATSMNTFEIFPKYLMQVTGNMQTSTCLQQNLVCT